MIILPFFSLLEINSNHSNFCFFTRELPMDIIQNLNKSHNLTEKFPWKSKIPKIPIFNGKMAKIKLKLFEFFGSTILGFLLVKILFKIKKQIEQFDGKIHVKNKNFDLTGKWQKSKTQTKTENLFVKFLAAQSKNKTNITI